MRKKFLIIFFFSFAHFAWAGSKEAILSNGNFILLGPPVINKDYYLFEFGFVTEKKIKSWDYNYNAFVKATLFEDWLKKQDHLRAGALGFKAGVFLPFKPWTPLLFSVAAGYAKTVLHKKPLFGNDKKSVKKKGMFLAEAGVLYSYKKFLVGWTYQVSNVSYFERTNFFSLGWKY